MNQIKLIFILISAMISLTLASCWQRGGKTEVLSKENSLLTTFYMKIPQRVGFINDFEQIFSIDERKALDSLVTAIEKETTAEIAVVTLDSNMANRQIFDDLSLFIANQWGIGKKGKDNGIVICISKSLKKIRIQNGLGIEKMISDKQTKEIIDKQMIPCFKNGDFFAGIRDGILRLWELVRN